MLIKRVKPGLNEWNEHNSISSNENLRKIRPDASLA